MAGGASRTGLSAIGRRYRRNRLTAAVASAALVWGSAARALDLSSENYARDATPALQENIRRWDDAPRQGVTGVTERSRPPWEPDGVRYGNFIVLPTIGTTVVYDDNVYATSAARRSDVRVDVVPNVRVISDLPRHVLDFAVGAKLSAYSRTHDLDTNDVYGSASGVLHFDHAHTLSVSVLSAFEHASNLTFGTQPTAREPTPVWHNRASVGLRRDAGRLYGAIGLVAESWDFKNVRAFDGATIDQDHRDLRMLSSHLALGYRFSPGFEWQGKVRALRQVNRGNEQLDSSAYGYDLITGLSFQTSPVVHFRLLGGYGIRDWDRPAQSSTGTGLLEAELKWLIAPSLTATVLGRRRFSEGLEDDAETGAVESTISAKLDYEVWRNLLFTLGGEYRVSDLIGQSRRDHTTIGRAGLEYLYTKNWQFSLGFEHLERQSNVKDFDLARNKVWLGAKLRF